MSTIKGLDALVTLADDDAFVLQQGDDTTGKTRRISAVQLGLRGGATGSRPATPILYQAFFDTTLTQPIWWTGSVWVDATGATV